MGEVPHLIPPNIKRYIASVERREQREEQRKAEARAKRIAILLAEGKTDPSKLEEAFQLMALDPVVPVIGPRLVVRFEC